MNSDRFGYEVTCLPVATAGVKACPGIFWTADAAKARALVDALPTHRKLRVVPWNEIPETQRKKFEQAERERS